jgi:endonuclease YncB( thermonuclease family)
MSRRAFRIVLSLPLAFVIGCSSKPLDGPTSVGAEASLPTVTRVIDGDTIVVEGVGT